MGTTSYWIDRLMCPCLYQAKWQITHFPVLANSPLLIIRTVEFTLIEVLRSQPCSSNWDYYIKICLSSVLVYSRRFARILVQHSTNDCINPTRWLPTENRKEFDTIQYLPIYRPLLTQFKKTLQSLGLWKLKSRRNVDLADNSSNPLHITFLLPVYKKTMFTSDRNLTVLKI